MEKLFSNVLARMVAVVVNYSELVLRAGMNTETDFIVGLIGTVLVFEAARRVVGMGVSWEVALTAVFAEGIIFIILSLCKVREAVVNAIPVNMKLAVSGGIGGF